MIDFEALEKAVLDGKKLEGAPEFLIPGMEELHSKLRERLKEKAERIEELEHLIRSVNSKLYSIYIKNYYQGVNGQSANDLKDLIRETMI